MSRRRGAIALLALFAMAAAAAEDAGPRRVPGDSAADLTDQANIAVWLMDHFRTQHDCLTAQTIFATFVNTDAAGANTERWTITHCGVVTIHVIFYVPGQTALETMVTVDEGRSEVVLPHASVSCAIDERKSIAKQLEARASDAASDEEKLQLRIYALVQRAGCYPRPLKALQQTGAALIQVVFSRDGKLLAHRLEQSSGDALMDAEARFVWTRIGALGRKLKIPKALYPGKDRIEISVPVGFRAH